MSDLDDWKIGDNFTRIEGYEIPADLVLDGTRIKDARLPPVVPRAFDLRTARADVLEARAKISIESRWSHTKSGGVYWVQAVGILEANGEPMVVYREAGSNDCWIRPVSEFLDGRFVRLQVSA